MFGGAEERSVKKRSPEKPRSLHHRDQHYQKVSRSVCGQNTIFLEQSNFSFAARTRLRTFGIPEGAQTACLLPVKPGRRRSSTKVTASRSTYSSAGASTYSCHLFCSVLQFQSAIKGVFRVTCCVRGEETAAI